MNYLAASGRGITMEFDYFTRTKMRGIKSMKSLDYRSGTLRLNDFEEQNHSLTDLKIAKNSVNLRLLFDISLRET